MLICPVCKEKLNRVGNRYVCKNNHSFDIAKQGYINLSLKQKKNQGDNRLMIEARSQFLNQDYYDFMRQKVCSLLEQYQVKSLVDSGCGQGYYTSKFSEICSKVIGIDLSKEGVKYASVHDKKAQYLVASIFDMPIASQSVDCVTSLFVPLAYQDSARILKDKGIWIVVGPGPRHCWELKELMYETPYENKMPSDELEGFEHVDQIIVSEKKTVHDVWALLEMTPYRYKTSSLGLQKAKDCEKLDVTFEFVINVWRKL